MSYNRAGDALILFAALTPRQGHIDAAGIAAMEHLLPHVQ